MTDDAKTPAPSRRGFLRAAAAGAALAPLAAARGEVVRSQGVQPGGTVLPDRAVGRPFPKDYPLPEQPPRPADGRRTGWAVVGLGDFGISRVIPAIARSERCRLTAVVSGNPEKARVVAGAYGVAEDAIYDYDTFDRIASDDRVDAVYIVLPNGLHAEWTERAFAVGKHVMCEKPMATTPAECERMIAARDRAGRELMIAYRAHFEPHNLRAMQLMREGAIGTQRTLVANHQRVLDLSVPRDVWRADLSLAGGGALPDLGIYGLNAAYYLTGESPTEVFASIATPEDDIRFREIEDQVTTQLRFPSGTLANLSTSYTAPGVNDITVYGTEGHIRMDPATSYEGNTLKLTKGGETQSLVDRDSAVQFPREVDHLSSVILDGGKVRTPGEMGLRDVRLIAAIYRSARERRPLPLAPDGTVREG